MSESVLLFRGEVQRSCQDEIIIDAMVGAAHSTRLQVAGRLTEAVLRVAKLAARPLPKGELVAALERELPLEAGVAFSLIEQLLEAGVLESEVNTATRMLILGGSELASQLRSRMAMELWPTELAGCEVVILGRLGSDDWKRELDRALTRSTLALTCSFEGSACWIGPVVSAQDAPCPLCLHARRVAALREPESPVALSCPPNLALVAALLRQVAETMARGELPHDRVLHVEHASSTWRTLLPQPHCAVCDRSALSECAPELAVRARQIAHDFETRLSVSSSVTEPSEPQRAAFVDPVLGPLTLEVYDADGSFRDLPLVLGSIRCAEATDHGFSRRERASVMFGTGATEHRRRLVAFAEGIERYAGSTERPDIVGSSYEALSPFALHPEQTVRFSAEQYASLSLERYTGQPTDWSWACDWTTGESKLLIHDAISCTERPTRGSFRMFQDPFASGMAAHRSLTLAVQRAALELIERDAMMLAWYLRLPLRPLDVRTIGAPSTLADLTAMRRAGGAEREPGTTTEVHDLISYLKQAGVNVSFYDLRVDFSVPCVLAIAETARDLGEWKAGGKILSASAGLTFADAVRHSLRELLGHYTVFGLVSPDGDKSIDPETGELRVWWPSFASFLSPRHDDPLDFLGKGDPLQLSADPELPLEQVRSELLTRGIPLYVRQLGRRDVHRSGLLAIRAVAPGLLRLTPTRQSVNFGEPRIDSIRLAWGANDGVNLMPHPLA
jgi:ribosomal protein S12 methylthiotransferase accessory factor